MAYIASSIAARLYRIQPNVTRTRIPVLGVSLDAPTKEVEGLFTSRTCPGVITFSESFDVASVSGGVHHYQSGYGG